ncbi:hypothetical protein LV28_10470 [Pandoraea pnomenusa]|uniref:Protein of uncharacterized function (DUF1439) n=1 Tax=Pandoraea pnomenusa TaxID=93220 RepID=A0A378YLD5_9BURK|nr:hypothetical protein U875_02845 [Pandoraea pnomenusa 3kgm]AIU26899.1 hypothetical protein LV28_10470 [Pandoraea pnomenusa]ANC47099.1 hypothetical protein A6P55_07800 [Pandoraea pnomenusa]SUA77628.1 Protein of uncharacterised function (DUF1439) [Pandoraea pnomenusa]
MAGRERPSSSSRRRWLSLTGAAVFAAGLAACAGLPFGNDYTFSEAQLQRALDRKFPFDRHVLAVLDVNLSHPRLTLLPERNRLAVAVDATIAHPLGGAPFTGTLAVESALAYDPATMSVVLRDPEVQNFTVDRLPERWSRQLNAAGALIATQLLQGAPIYTFKPEQLNIGGIPRQPGEITVLSHGVNVRFDSR